jgi:site-specific recombinase XerD
MSYSITTELHPYADAHKQHKVRLLVICNRMKARYSLSFKVEQHQLRNDEIVEHPNKSKLTAWLKKERNELESRLIDLLKYERHPTLQQLTAVVQDKELQQANGPITTVQDMLQCMIEENKNTLSEGRLKHYAAFMNLLNDFKPMWTFKQFTHPELANFHQHLINKGHSINTVWSKFNILKTIRTHAVKRALLKIDPFLLYRSPKYVQGIPSYINEEEMAQLLNVVTGISNDQYRMVGYYFLLSCYSGYRISDLKKFDYAVHVKNKRLVLHTTKTGEVVSIIIHTRLKPVLDYCKEQRLTCSEKECNANIKKLAPLANIHRPLNMHSARHSFAMMFAEHGATLEDVMKLMGINNPAVAKIYFRITNKRLDAVVMDKLG